MNVNVVLRLLIMLLIFFRLIDSWIRLLFILVVVFFFGV